MCKKLIVLASVALTLGLGNVGDAADILWTGAGADNLWDNGANWEGNKAPGAADWAHIESPGATAPNGPVIQDGMHIEINGMSNELPGEPTLTITGGTLILTGWGIWWGDAADCHATCYMSGGTMELTGGPGIHEFGWGGASGKWIMTGGTVNARGVVLSTGPGNTGELYLHGGTYNIGTSRAERSDRFGGGLLVNDGGLIDITEGTLVMEVLPGEEGRFMQYLEDLMAAGQITAHGGAGGFDMDFDGRNPGKITLTAVEAGKAYNPDPADGSIYEDTWASLSWSPADAAVSHDLYLGEDLEDVKSGTGDTFRGNQSDTFFIIGFFGYPYPDGLVPGTTYYWRVDEVEADGTVHEGDVWGFTVPPKTAFNPDPVDAAESVDLNAVLSWSPGFGALFHTVYFGEDYDAVNTATGGTQQSQTTYTPGPLANEKVYYWRVDEIDADTTHQGDVWTFTMPGAVGNPQPANGAMGVQMTATLAWTPADNATSHQLYLGTDQEAVRSATTASPQYVGSKALGSESHDPGKLAWDTSYYWRVDAVYTDPANPVKGPLWSFKVADFITVDDFESYNDINPGEPGSNRILEAWEDGFGTTTNGALVGHDLPPYAEQTIVHGGAQSMPYSYDNNLKFSEATKTLTYPTDWTEEGVGVLSLWFRGKADNGAERMYVALNGIAIYHENANATQVTNWQEWVIPLSAAGGFADLGVDLTNVTTISIGFGTQGDTTRAGGSGQMYFDDIRLFRPGISDVSPITITVPNGDFEQIYKPGSDTITADLGDGWTQGLGPDAPMDDGIATYSDGTTGDAVDIPGWIGADAQGWIDNGGTYNRDTSFPNRQGSVARQTTTPDGLYYYLANGGDWGNAAGGLIVSDAPLGNVEDGTYTLSMLANGAANPVVLELLADGVALTPSSSEDPQLSSEWQEFSRTYDAASLAGHLGKSLTIRLGVGRGASGTQSHFDAVSLSYVPESAEPAMVSITIVNPGFEDPVLAEDDYTWGDVPGWTLVGGEATGIEGSGVWNTTSADFDPVLAPEGQNVLYTEYLPEGIAKGVAQVLTETFAANADYTLTVEIGNSNYYYNGGYSVQLLAGGVVIAEDNDTLWPDYKTWATSTVEYTYDPADAALVGQPLEIRLLNLDLDKDSPPAGEVVGVEFDNVTLTK